jgi:hypothetical protein
MKAARLPKGFAAFYQNYARAEILLACYHSLLELNLKTIERSIVLDPMGLNYRSPARVGLMNSTTWSIFEYSLNPRARGRDEVWRQKRKFFAFESLRAWA